MCFKPLFLYLLPFPLFYSQVQRKTHLHQKRKTTPQASIIRHPPCHHPPHHKQRCLLLANSLHGPLWLLLPMHQHCQDPKQRNVRSIRSTLRIPCFQAADSRTVAIDARDINIILETHDVTQCSPNDCADLCQQKGMPAYCPVDGGYCTCGKPPCNANQCTNYCGTQKGLPGYCDADGYCHCGTPPPITKSQCDLDDCQRQCDIGGMVGYCDEDGDCRCDEPKTLREGFPFPDLFAPVLHLIYAHRRQHTI